MNRMKLIVSVAAGMTSAVVEAEPMEYHPSARRFQTVAAYANQCGRCHEVQAPQRRTDPEWDRLLHRMRSRAHLSDREMQQILSYLQTSN